MMGKDYSLSYGFRRVEKKVERILHLLSLCIFIRTFMKIYQAWKGRNERSMAEEQKASKADLSEPVVTPVATWLQKGHIIPEGAGKKDNISEVLPRGELARVTLARVVRRRNIRPSKTMRSRAKNNCAGGYRERRGRNKSFAGIFLPFRRKLGVRDRKRAVESRNRVRNACRIDFPVTGRMFGRRIDSPGYSASIQNAHPNVCF